MPIILHHHERYAGHGYPYGLRANEIPLGARIVAIADAYDAMIHDRPYKRAMSHDAGHRRAAPPRRARSSTRSWSTLFCDLYAAHAPRKPDPTVLAMTQHDAVARQLVVPAGRLADQHPTGAAPEVDAHGGGRRCRRRPPAIGLDGDGGRGVGLGRAPAVRDRPAPPDRLDRAGARRPTARPTPEGPPPADARASGGQCARRLSASFP